MQICKLVDSMQLLCCHFRRNNDRDRWRAFLVVNKKIYSIFSLDLIDVIIYSTFSSIFFFFILVHIIFGEDEMCAKWYFTIKPLEPNLNSIKLKYFYRRGTYFMQQSRKLSEPFWCIYHFCQPLKCILIY